MSGSLTRDCGKTFPAHAQPSILLIWQEAHPWSISHELCTGQVTCFVVVCCGAVYFTHMQYEKVSRWISYLQILSHARHHANKMAQDNWYASRQKRPYSIKSHRNWSLACFVSCNMNDHTRDLYIVVEIMCYFSVIILWQWYALYIPLKTCYVHFVNPCVHWYTIRRADMCDGRWKSWCIRKTDTEWVLCGVTILHVAIHPKIYDVNVIEYFCYINYTLCFM